MQETSKASSSGPDSDRDSTRGGAGSEGPPVRKKPRTKSRKSSSQGSDRGSGSGGATTSRETSGHSADRLLPSSLAATTGAAASSSSSAAQAEAAAAAAANAERLQLQALNEQMRRALEEEQYSANGSIVDTESDDDGEPYLYRGQPVRLDRAALLQAVRKYTTTQPYYSYGGTMTTTTGSHAGAAGGAMGASVLGATNVVGPVPLHARDASGGGGSSSAANYSSDSDGRNMAALNRRDGRNVLTSRGGGDGGALVASGIHSSVTGGAASPGGGIDTAVGGGGGGGTDFDDVVHASNHDLDGGSIFGQTTGSSNSTWVECDKCKKWRRLRGVVDEKKLPSKWYCSMNKNGTCVFVGPGRMAFAVHLMICHDGFLVLSLSYNSCLGGLDPERARCSAPEEAYETPHTPESAADARTRKHLRVWVRRLQCNEAYEARQPTLTRGKKRAAASSSKEPYEWVRCCNPSCGKWRALLRIMDAKSSVMDRTTDGEWYCVMNTWDEKAASCAAPQENLPAVGCPPWVMQDDDN